MGIEIWVALDEESYGQKRLASSYEREDERSHILK